MSARIFLVLISVFTFVCTVGFGPSSLAASSGREPETLLIPAGSFIRGSDPAEREAAYRLDEAAYGHSRTRAGQWYAREHDRAPVRVPAYRITKYPITNRAYAAFVAATGHRTPDVTPEIWAEYRLVHPYARTRRHAWADGVFPKGRADHPVVLVSLADARAYAAWLSQQTGVAWRLPTEDEWEKAARGTEGWWFPWGDAYDPTRLNAHDLGPFDTTPVGSYPSGDSPFGLSDPAGHVFEWTRTPWSDGRVTVKGGSWDDRGYGVCRPAARHGRPVALKHILIGFRLVRDPDL